MNIVFALIALCALADGEWKPAVFFLALGVMFS